MPLEFQDSRHLEVAHGYIELAMWEEANEQLEAIDAFCRTAPEVLAARIEIYHGLKKWELMREISKRVPQTPRAMPAPLIKTLLRCKIQNRQGGLRNRFTPLQTARGITNYQSN
jgi:hypothetical protein